MPDKTLTTDAYIRTLDAGPPIETWTKDPAAVKPYTLDWSGTAPGPWLDTGDTISVSTWIVPSGITKDSESNTTTTTTITLSGGTAGQDYQLINQVVTANGITEERTFEIQCREE